MYVYTTFEDGSLVVSNVAEGVCVQEYSSVTKDVSATITGSTITVSLGANAVSSTYSSGADYEIVLMQDGAEIDRRTLKNADVTYVPGNFFTAATVDAAAQFEVSDPDGNYSVTVRALSTSEFYVDAPVSAPFPVTEPTADASLEASGEAADETASAEPSGEAS